MDYILDNDVDVAPITSFTHRQWNVIHTDNRRTLAIMQKFNLPEVIAKLLVSLNIDLEEISHFISPSIRHYLPDPFHLKDMDKAVERIMRAIKNNEECIIFADYDVDGATSSSILKLFFKEIGYNNCQIYVPDRFKEGYGLSTQAINKFIKDKKTLVITLDCGTLSFEALQLAKDNGIDAIVIDHHISDTLLPKAYAIVNPNRVDETSDLTYLAAVGVTFVTIVALRIRLREQQFFDTLQEPNLMTYLDIVALGTVCDVVPLVGLNRAIVAQGLKYMSKSCNIGLNSLIDVCKIKRDNISEYHCGYILGPRINAGSRMESSSYGYTLFTSQDQQETNEISLKLNQLNQERKVTEQAIYEIAVEQASQQQHDNIIVVSGQWHLGIIGIISSKITEKFNKPSAVITILECGKIGKASCRSIPGIDLGSSIIDATNKDILMAGGGHSMAAGFTIKADKINDLRQFLNNKFNDIQKYIASHRTYHYLLHITLNAVNDQIADLLNRCSPYGTSNKEPYFVLNQVFISNIRLMPNHDGMICTLSNHQTSPGKTVKAVMFGVKSNSVLEQIMEINKWKKPVSCLGYIRVNRYQLLQKAEFMIKDIANAFIV